MYRPLKGLIAPQLTPFNADESVNYSEYTRLTSFLTHNGADGVFVCGTSGEFVNLELEERMKLMAAARKGVSEDGTILFNVTALNLNDVKKLCDCARAEGADAVSFTPPFYHVYDEEALVSFFQRCIEKAGDMPVYLYNMPGMTKNPITPAILKRVCSSCPTIKGIKDSSMDYMTFLEFQNCHIGDDFNVITGNDAQVLTTLMAGADTAVIAMVNVFPALCKSIFTLYGKGDIQGAREAQDKVMELRKLVRSIMPIVSHKEMLKLAGFDMGPSRFPFRNLRKEEKERISKEIERLGLMDELKGERR